MNAFARSSKVAAYQGVAAYGGVLGADAHGLVQILLDTALERLTASLGCIERGETARKAKLLHSSVRIVAELRGSLNIAAGGALAQNLSDLYEYMIRRLLRANVESDAACVKEVLSLLGEIRSAWTAIGPAVRQRVERPPQTALSASAASTTSTASATSAVAAA